MNEKNIIRSGGLSYSYSRSAANPENLEIRHCHDSYEILYVSEGAGKYTVEGAEYPIRPRTLIVIPPFSYHCVSIKRDNAYARCVINFHPCDLTVEAQSLLSKFTQNQESGGLFYSEDAVTPSIVSVFDRFEYSDSLPKEERALYLKLMLSELVLLLSVASNENIPSDEGELGARVIRYLNEHIYKDITLDKLAKRFFVSKYYLCRAFKKHNGISVHGYINQKRVMYAKQLIESGETASAAAYRVGFGDYSVFYRAYIKIIGRSPTSQTPERSQ